MGQSLTAVGTLGHLSVMFDPSVVEGLQAPALKAQLSADDALGRLLSGTKLRAVRVDANTIRVEPTPKRTQTSATSVPTGDSYEHSPSAIEPDQTENTQHTKKLEEVVITGTHIRNESPASPVISIGQDEIERSGYQSTGDLIRSLPQSFSGGYNGTVSGTGNGTSPYNPSGASSANLRGLGSESTLTLVNGHRLAYADQVNVVDVSLIPLPAVDRIEIVTDGASAVYGSDAVAGVVNFILRRGYNGLDARATVGDSTDGGGLLNQYDVLAGKTWDTGGALLSYEFSHQDPIHADERSFTAPEVAQTTLVPKTNRNSFFINAYQSVGEDAELFLQGLYTKRSSDSSANFAPGSLSYDNADVQQFGVTAGSSVRIGEAWRGSLSGDYSKNSTHDPQENTFIGSPGYVVQQRFRNRLTEGDVNADGPLVHLPSGSVQAAVGTSYRTESLYEVQAVGPITSTDIVAGKRDVASAYAELNVPIVEKSETRIGLQSLVLTLAGRYDDYSDFGPSRIPKIGLVYRTSNEIEIKASWGKSFRAPSLLQEVSQQTVYLFDIADPASQSGTSQALFPVGGNPALKPERSTAKTLDLEYRPAFADGLKIDATYYEIKYQDRIIQPISVFSLTDPFESPFITLRPSAARQASLLALASTPLQNFSSGPYDPSTVSAILDDRFTNATNERARGGDLLLNYHFRAPVGEMGLSFNGTYTDLVQQLSAVSPVQRLSGTIFNPPKTRLRAGATWERGGWTSSLFVNYVGTSRDPTETPPVAIASWTTADSQFGYRFGKTRWSKDTRILLSIQNVLDARPPFVLAEPSTPGLHFDSTNASGVGRFISMQIAANW